MKLHLKLLFCLLFCFQIAHAQENSNAALLKIILSKYYTNEKVIVKDRLQTLFLFCQKSNNNEEVFETITKSEILKNNATEIRHQVQDKLEENWAKEYDVIFATENKYLKSKVNNCSTLEDFQKLASTNNLNYYRLLIVGKPMYFAKKYCLIKVAIYRTIEHNSSRFLLFENINGKWEIKETLNEWET